MSASGNYIVESDLTNWDDEVSLTEEFATGAVDTENDRIALTMEEETIATASLCRFSSTGGLPAPLVTGTAYYAIYVDPTHIQVATTPVNAAAGTAIDLTTVGTGTHTLDVGEGSSTADRQEIIDRAEHLIEKITRDYFYSEDFVIYRDGNDKDRLFLGLTPDILTVTEILISGVELTSSWWTNDVTSVYLDPEAVTTEESDMAELHLRLKYRRRLFPEGMGNIKITGTYGWSSCPGAIKQAAIILCEAENDPTLHPAYGGQLKSEKLGDYSYTLAEVDGSTTTGIDKVDKLIVKYIRKKPILSVA